MAFSESVRFALILSSLIAKAVSQSMTAPAILTSEYCSQLDAYSTLTACDHYSYSRSSYIFNLEAEEMASRYCDQNLFDLEFSCVLESRTCAGTGFDWLSSFTISTHIGDCSDFVSENLLSSFDGNGYMASLTSMFPPAAIFTDATNDPFDLGSSQTPAPSPAPTSSSLSEGFSFSYTYTAKPRTSATPARASATKLTGATSTLKALLSSAPYTRPALSVLYLFVGLGIVSVLV